MRSLTILQLKIELKLAASLIKSKKPLYRSAQSQRSVAEWKDKEINKNCSELETQVAKLRFEFRHKHIVYCLLRGKSREQIERKKEPCNDFCPKNPYCCHKASEKEIEKLFTHYAELLSKEVKEATSETLCAHAS